MIVHLLPNRARDSRRSPQLAIDRDSIAFRFLCAEIEDGLRSIDLDGVTIEDRLPFVELSVVWQMRRALRSQRFDLALRLHGYGVDLLADLEWCRTRPRLQPGRMRIRAGRAQR
jgi:hypothetical protein